MRNKKIIVNKLGGVIMGSAKLLAFAKVEIVRQMSKHCQPIVVVSALQGVTDDLVAILNKLDRLVNSGIVDSTKTQFIINKFIECLRKKHSALVEQLIVAKENNELVKHRIIQILKKLRQDLETVTVRGALPELQDRVLSFGEKLASIIFSIYLTDNKINVESLTSEEIGIITNENHLDAEIDYTLAKSNIIQKLKKCTGIPVITGFTGITISKKTTTLGRGGSDATACFIGAALSAKKIILWKDVPGVLSADPNIFPNAKTLKSINYMEAEKSGKVIFDKAVQYLKISKVPTEVTYIRDAKIKTQIDEQTKTELGAMQSKSKIPVAILGATGMVGQRLISLLANHPLFEVAVVAASVNSAGKTYREAVLNKWTISSTIPDKVKDIIVMEVNRDKEKIARVAKIAFSALDIDKNLIKRLEIEYASLGVAVISNNSAHRWTKDIPMIIPEVNSSHTKLIDIQRRQRKWKTGLIAVKPNCSIQSYVPVLEALKKFMPTRVIITTLQAISGAGKTFKSWPEMHDNIIPFIGGEEEKSEQEPMKIWGKIVKDKLRLATLPKISATCIRVSISNGHMAAVSVKFKKNPTKQDIINSIINFKNPIRKFNLPSAPKNFIEYIEKNDRPQIKLDRDNQKGMGITVGRIREDSILDWKFIVLSHNTLRGAAGGAVLMAELLVHEGYII